MRRALRAGLTVAGTGLLAGLLPSVATAAPACAPTVSPADEAQLTALINQRRAAQGKAPLRTKPMLVRPARGWSLAMARGGAFTHSASLAWAGGRASAQNIAQAPSGALAFQAMMASPPHRKNLLARLYRVTGVGAARSCTGQVFFTINLMAPA